MEIRHDREADAIKITLNDKKHHISQMVRDDLILKLDENDRIVAIEILDVSANIAQPDTFEYVDITHTRYDEKIKADTTN